MRLNLDLPQKTLDDLTILADYHAVPIEDVVRHYITDGIEAEKRQRLGPWESVDGAFNRLQESSDKLENSFERLAKRMRINGNVRRLK